MFSAISRRPSWRGELGLAVGHQFFRPRRHVIDLFWRMYKKGDLEIQEKAAHVHICRPDHGEAVVEENGLGVQHHGLIQEDPSAGGVQVAQIARAGQIGRDVIGAFGHDQPDVDPAPGRQGQGPGQHLVRNVVRGDDPDGVCAAKIKARSAS